MDQYPFLIDAALAQGFDHAGIIPVEKIPFDPIYRKACEANQCGCYGKCWTCPPDVGPIEDLMARAKTYRWAVVYQSIGKIEDSFDIEGMLEAGAAHNRKTLDFIEKTEHFWQGKHLHLSAGGCRICPRCAKRDNQPCRFPDKALASLEAYGIGVAQLAPKVGMKYINGANTVTYFGLCFFDDASEGEKAFRLTVKDGENSREKTFPERLLLSEAMGLAGEPLDLPCAGNGRCGKCRVLAEGALSPVSPEEKKLLSPEDLAAGYRLACRTYLEGEARVTLSAKSDIAAIETAGVARSFVRDGKPGFGIGVDIGTTTVAATLISMADGKVLASACRQNPQEKFGADVISRIERSLAGDGPAEQEAICGCVEELLGELCQKANISGENISALVITGNTTMLYLLTGRDVDCLSHAPFDADQRFGKVSDLRFAAIPRAKCYLTRCNSAFVGGDITTATLASGIAGEEKTALLIDVGTNGEIVLAHQGKLYCSSTAAGPALEGAGIYMGMPALGGAIRSVSLADGKIAVETVGGLPDQGICGSGVIDAMALLLKTGAVDETGFLLEEDHGYTDRICEAGDALAFRLGEKTLFTQKDIRAVQLAKAAICAGIRTLLHEAGLTPDKVERFVIAGGFGSHIQVENAAAIGLFPAELADKAEVLGNAALEGALMLLQREAFYPESEALAQSMETVDLSSNPYFSDQYMEGMLFEV